MSKFLSPDTVSAGFTREAYNAIQKAQSVSRYLVENFADRIRELIDLGMNQTEISVRLGESELEDFEYGTPEILRTATSDAVRVILTPAEAEAFRLRSWRNALAENATPEGRLKGIRARNKIYGLPGGVLEWSDDEERELVRVAKQALWPKGSRYEGMPQWQRVTEIMHGFDSFPKRESNAYKQRYSILEASKSKKDPAHITHQQTDDTAAPPPRVSV